MVNEYIYITFCIFILPVYAEGSLCSLLHQLHHHIARAGDLCTAMKRMVLATSMALPPSPGQ